MELQDERKEEVYRYKLGCTAEEEEVLRKLAIRRFAKDRQAQLEYAVRSILAEAVDTINLDDMAEKRDKNGNKNNNRK
jgi:transposase